ncbi:MAG: hypothetical protein WC558_09385 [Patulibacter sp.]
MRSPRGDAERAPTTWGPRVLLVAALAGPVWPTYVGSLERLTVGRVLLVLLALAALRDIVVVRGNGTRPPRAVGALLAPLVALALWTGCSAALWGEATAGVAQGFAELVALVGLTAVVGSSASSRWALATLGAAAVGVLAGGTLAAAGAQDLHAAAYAPSASFDRLEGVYGNPNFLGFAIALALPAGIVGVVRLRGPGRWVTLLATAALAVMLLETFSRGSLLAAAFGVPVALWLGLQRRPPRAVAVIVALVVPIVTAAVILSPNYRDQREQANFGPPPATATATKPSGPPGDWSSAAAGPVTVAGAALGNPPPRGIVIVPNRAGQGVHGTLGRASADGRAGLRFSVLAQTRSPVHWRVGDGRRAVAQGTVVVGQTPRIVRAPFTARRGERYRFFLWTDRTVPFMFLDVSLSERRPGAAATTRPVSTVLPTDPTADTAALEADYNRSRWSAARLALSAWTDQPLRGIGLGRFPAYADAHDRFGPIPTHNTYLQVLAELGVPGILLLMSAIAVVVLALRRGRSPAPLRAVLVGTLVVGAVNLLFINGLAAPGTAMPLILALGLAVAWARPTHPAPDRDTG